MKSAIQIPDKKDGFDDIRLEFREMLKNQIVKGNNGLKKSKYVTFTVEADNLEQATSKLERLEIDILSNLKSMGIRAESLTGEERLKILHDILNPNKTFEFSYKDLKKKESTKTYITPDEFNFTPSRYFKFGKFIGAVSHFQILASELSDRMLAEYPLSLMNRNPVTRFRWHITLHSLRASQIGHSPVYMQTMVFPVPTPPSEKPLTA